MPPADVAVQCAPLPDSACCPLIQSPKIPIHLRLPLSLAFYRSHARCYYLPVAAFAADALSVRLAMPCWRIGAEFIFCHTT
jgi:hypothetical protein